MGKLLILLTFLGSSPALDYKYHNASDESRRALLEYSFVKEEVHKVQTDLEKKVYDVTGLTPNELVYVGYIQPLVTRRFSSKPFKNFQYRFGEWSLRPELEYSFGNDPGVTTYFVISKGF